MAEINVILCNLPHSIKGFTRNNPDSSYTIVLNSRFNQETRLRTYFHEIKHIESNDFDNVERCADKIELDSHFGSEDSQKPDASASNTIGEGKSETA